MCAAALFVTVPTVVLVVTAFFSVATAATASLLLFLLAAFLCLLACRLSVLKRSIKKLAIVTPF